MTVKRTDPKGLNFGCGGVAVQPPAPDPLDVPPGYHRVRMDDADVELDSVRYRATVHRTRRDETPAGP